MHYLRLDKVSKVRTAEKYKVEGVGFRKDDMGSINLSDLPHNAMLLDFDRNIFCIDKRGSGLCFAKMEDYFILYHFSGLWGTQYKLAEGKVEGDFEVEARKYSLDMKFIEIVYEPGKEFMNMVIQGLMICGGISKNKDSFKRFKSDYYGGRVNVFQ